MPNTQTRAPLVLFYDNDCGLCTAAVEWYLTQSTKRRRAPILVPYGDLTAPARYPQVDWNHRDRGIQVIRADGTIFQNAAAMAVALQELGVAGKIVGTLMSLPIISSLCEIAYRTSAKNRYRISQLFGLKQCKLPSEKA